MLTIIDRYIFKYLLATFAFVVLILTAVITVIDITEKMEKFSYHHLKLGTILEYYGGFIPWIMGYLTPITVFIAVIYVTSRLAGHSEIIAMYSSGMSFWRLLVPYMVVSMVIGGISFCLNGWVIPKATRVRLDFEMKYINSPRYMDDENIHFQIAPNLYMYIQRYNNTINKGYNVSLDQFKGNELIEKLIAESVEWDTIKNRWTLYNWKITKVNNLFSDSMKLKPSQLTQSGNKLDSVLAITPQDFEEQDRSFDGMTIPELKAEVAKKKSRGMTGFKVYEIENQIRYAAPFSTFVLVFLGATVSSRKSRGGTGLQIAIGFVLAFIFIIFFQLSNTFAQAGEINPAVAAWIPNVTFTFISSFINYLLLK